MKNSSKLQPRPSGYSSAPEKENKTKIGSIVSAFPVDYFTLIFCCLLAASLIAFFLLTVQPLVFLRADILLWEETDFVGNMIKFNIGAPLYTAPADSNSMIYNPASFLLTYAISWLLGQTKSVETWRIIQLGFAACAALVATVCSRKLYRLAFPGETMRFRNTWMIFVFLAMFLAATAPHSNQFVYTLHVDSLALLVSIASFWALLRYFENESYKNLIIMATFPALGFLTKQFLISWGAVMLIFLFLQNPKNLKKHGLFIAMSGGFTLIAFSACYLIWGDNYLFWTTGVTGGIRKNIAISPDAFSISIPRSLDHLARVWLEVFVGIIGAWLLVRKANFRRLGPIFAAWFALVLAQALVSGVGWNVLYHFGPSVLIGSVFMFTALPQIWSREVEKEKDETSTVLKHWSRAFLMVAAIVAIFSAWHVIPSGDKNHPRYLRGYQVSPDVDRYIIDIESEFEGIQPDKVLVDVGSWVYLRHDVLQKDRAVSLGDQPPNGMYQNFDITVDRIRNKAYKKIIVHDFHSPYFLYDWSDWKKPSGFRAALLENYVEVKTIAAPEGYPLLTNKIFYTGPVSVFVQRE